MRGKGSENGIGSTIIVHDGGGSFRTKDGILFEKGNGCGVDFVLSVIQAMTDIAQYDPKVSLTSGAGGGSPPQFFQEVRRSSEMGLFALTCNVIKGPEGNQEVVSRIIELCVRFYTTEMRLQNDAMCSAALQAILTSVPRQTRSCNPNIQTSTEIDKRLNIRVPLQYVQKLAGYFAISTNHVVGPDNIERFGTLAKVTRCIPSCADPIDAAARDEDCTDQTIAFGQQAYVHSAQHTAVMQSPKCRCVFQQAYGVHIQHMSIGGCRAIFLSSFCVAQFSCFMQWTGMLGKMPACMIMEQCLQCLYAQLELSKDILNPLKYSADDKNR